MMITQSFWEGKRVLVTGHTGFKGSWLCEILLKLGADLTGYALKPPTDPSLFVLCGLVSRMNSVIGDVRNLQELQSTFEAVKPEIVIHMAAQPIVLDSYKQPVYTYETNIMGTVNVLECVRQTDLVKSFLNVTTDKVYFNANRREGYREGENLCGYDPYANSKSCAELVTYSYNHSFLREKGVAVSTARSGNVIGGGDFADNRLIPDCYRAVSKGKVVKLRNPDSIRPYQHVLDTLFAYLLIAENQYENIKFADNYNIAPAETDCKTSAELAGIFCKVWGNGAKWESISVKGPHEDHYLQLNCDKIRRILNWSPKWDTVTAVHRTVEFYKATVGKVRIMQGQIEEFLINE